MAPEGQPPTTPRLLRTVSSRDVADFGEEDTVGNDLDASHSQAAVFSVIGEVFYARSPVLIRHYMAHDIETELDTAP